MLLVVDLQDEFNDYTGQFEKVLGYVKNYKGTVIATRYIPSEDGVYLKYDTWFDSYGSPLRFTPSKVYNHSSYGLLDYEELDKSEHYEIVGFNTEASVLKIAEDMFEKGFDISVNVAYCGSGSGKETHNSGVELLEDVLGSLVVYNETIGEYNMGREGISDIVYTQNKDCVLGEGNNYYAFNERLDGFTLLYMLSHSWSDIEVEKKGDYYLYRSTIYDGISMYVKAKSHREMFELLSDIVGCSLKEKYKLEEEYYLGSDFKSFDLTEYGTIGKCGEMVLSLVEDDEAEEYYFTDGERVLEIEYLVQQLSQFKGICDNTVEFGEITFLYKNIQEVYVKISNILYSYVNMIDLDYVGVECNEDKK